MSKIFCRKAETAAAQVTCTDGTMSKPGRGACSGHGGVKGAAVPAATAAPAPKVPAAVPATSPARTRSEAKSAAPTATAAPKTAAKTAAKASSNRGEDDDPTDAIAQCKDGKYSHAANHRGACSKHGGVAKFLKP